MQTLVGDLLDYAKLNSKKSQEFVEQDMNLVVKQVTQNLHNGICKSGASIEINQLPMLDVIPVKINQLFQNLLHNAIKFRKNNVPLHISILCEELKDHYRFSIKDNGIGIEKEYLKLIFEPFKKLHSEFEYKGSGIGLATCKKIVELHKGEMSVDSTYGYGTTFFFTLPKNLKDEKISSELVQDLIQSTL